MSPALFSQQVELADNCCNLTQDTIVSAQHMKTQGLGFFLHGIGCGTAFLFTLKPFLMFCGPNFLIVSSSYSHCAER